MFQILRRSLPFLAACFALPMAADATLLTINNPSFETPVTGAGNFSGFNNAAPAGWSVYNTVAANNDRFFGVWNPTGTNSYPAGAPDGVNVGVVFLDNTIGIAEAGLQQALAATLQLSTQYTLTVEVGNFGPSLGDPWNFTGFPGYRVDLFAGATLLASDNNTLLPGEGQFVTSSFSVTTGLSHANAGQALAIRLVNLNGSGVEVNFDRVRLDATLVPEPSGAALCSLAALLAMNARRRTARR
jgi:hapalindole H/12-epi-hapalindole U/12-epi-fischerindole U synthase